jgi:hypothetical protein
MPRPGCCHGPAGLASRSALLVLQHCAVDNNLLQWLISHAIPHTQGLSNRRQDEGGIEDRGKGHEADANGESISNLVGCSHDEPGLAQPAGSNQSDEWRIGAPEQRVEGVDLTLPPNQWGQEPRQGAHESRTGAARTIRIGELWKRSSGFL